jgi:hypothetical protein
LCLSPPCWGGHRFLCGFPQLLRHDVQTRAYCVSEWHSILMYVVQIDAHACILCWVRECPSRSLWYIYISCHEFCTCVTDNCI